MKSHRASKLKDINSTDLLRIFNWRNQKNIRSVMLNSDPLDWNQHLEWFAKYERDANTLSKIFYYNDIPYGVLNIKGLSSQNYCCDWGFYIGDEEAPKGLGTLLGYTSLNYIFCDLAINEVQGEVVETNHRSISFHEKLGFRKIGQIEKNTLHHEATKNLIIYRLNRKQWDKKKEMIKELIKGRLL